MTKKFFKMTCAAIAACIMSFSVFSLQSCSSEEEVTEVSLPQDIKPDERTAFREDLRQFLSDYQCLLEELNDQSGTVREYGPRREPGHIGDSIYALSKDSIGKLRRDSLQLLIGNHMQNFLANHNMTSDLTPHEIEGLNISEEQMEVLTADPDSFIVYATEYKTQAFCNYYQTLFVEKTPLALNTLLNDSDLKMNELLTLTVIATTLNDDPIFLADPEYKTVNEKQRKCYSEYQLARKYCGYKFGGKVLFAVLVDILSGGSCSLGTIADIIMAAVDLDNCLDDVLENYRECRK